MKILLIFATQHEATAIQSFLKKKPVTGNRFRVGNHEAELLICGVGMVQAAINTAIRLSKPNGTELVVHAGISGSYLQSPGIGQAVLINSECFPELGKTTTNGFVTLDQMGFGFTNLNFHNNTLKNPFLTNHLLPGYAVVGGATVNTITTNGDRATAIHQQFGALTESMEGGAVLAACLATQVACIQLRVISNFCLPPPADRWNLKAATEKLQTIVVETIKCL